MNRRHMVAIGALVVFAGIGAFSQSKLVVWPSESIKWTEIGGVAGGKQAVLWGDPAKGAFGALKQVPPGAVLPLHSHKADSRVVVVKGTIGLEINGKTTSMTPGSYSLIPGGVAHMATCTGKSLCEYFEQMDSAFDFTPVKR